MANVTSSKVFKIKPENQVIADAEVIDCKFAGTTSVGFGPFAKTSYIYKVYIQIDGVIFKAVHRGVTLPSPR